MKKEQICWNCKNCIWYEDQIMNMYYLCQFGIDNINKEISKCSHFKKKKSKNKEKPNTSKR